MWWKRKDDAILLVKLILGREILNINSTYVPQVELDERQFWENLDQIM